MSRTLLLTGFLPVTILLCATRGRDSCPTSSQRDGKYRRVEVKVRRSGLYVQTRNGYWAPDDPEKKK